MSDKPRFSAAEAMKVASPLLKQLTEVCHKVQIAGSLRRRKPMVGDIELLFIPKMAERKKDFFETEQVSLAEEMITYWLNTGLIAKRPSKIGVFTWGKENKLAVHVPTGIPIDFFSTTEPKWFMSLVVRTGPKESNIGLIQAASRNGLQLHAYGVYTRKSTGEQVFPTSEKEVFDLAGVHYLEPQDRL